MQDAAWHGWSEAALEGGLGRLVTGPVVCAELSRHADNAAGLADLVEMMGARLLPWSLEASFRAGRAFGAYRKAGGRRQVIVADLLTGGHAASVGATVLTRDPRRIRAYFPELELITPDQKA